MIPGGPDTASDSGLRACLHFPASPKPAPVETISSRVACRDAHRAWVWHSQWAGLGPRTARSRDGRTRTPTSSRPRSAPDCSRRLSTPRPSSASTTRHRADDFDDVQEQVKVRGQRRQVFARSAALRLWAILAESALPHRVSDDDVIQQQLNYLLTAAQETNIQIQVLPTSAPINAALFGPFDPRLPGASRDGRRLRRQPHEHRPLRAAGQLSQMQHF
ncbi:Scr1 family TA system antitoxin-like transcriptional regulator [Streptomyces sp. NBC_00063]|uniref:Scr1 family TA system antitoxin-like transcriptional regulator n=1 Tax=Streptomyces sp. NBC_00063 TaxID=2975638 RepID=UPI0022555763|nr:Scr1 family TA system antitoxin-like transcriptional regulator [Streptomyces sp. NBC_00063]MCX5441274.1 DUF5753 domain-containing protein [Streptomyces sp. NBC_00063]